MAGLARADALTDAIAAAAPLNVEQVAAPISDTRGGEIQWIPNGATGGWNVLIRYYEGYITDNHLVMIDLISQEIRQHHFETGAYGIQIVAANGKGFGHTAQGVMVYDPATNDIRFIENSGVGGETKPMVLGPDGKIYGTGSQNHRVVAYQIDPETETFTSYGQVGPSHGPNPCWGYFVSADDRYVYIVSGKLPWYLVAYDRQAGTSDVLLTHKDPDGIIMLGEDQGCVTAQVRYSDGKPAQNYWVAGGKAIARTDNNPPAQARAQMPKPAAPPRPALVPTGGSTMPIDGAGTVELWLNANAQAPTPPSELAGWKPLQFKIPVHDANIYQVITLPDGRIAGTGGHYMGLFIYDPETNEVVRTRKLGASVPVLANLDGITYANDYPRARMFAFDSAQPMDASNPRDLGPLGNYGSGIHRTFGIATAADGRVYVTGAWHRNGEGGGLGWWDPAAQALGGTHEGMGNYRTTHITTTGNGRYVVLSTHTVFDQETQIPAPDTAKIFVYDTQTGQLKSFPTLAGAVHTGAITGVDGTQVLAITLAPDPADEPWHQRGSILYAFDAVSGEVLWQKPLPWAVGFLVNENLDNTVPFDFKRGPDGKVWTWTGGEQQVVNPARPWGLAYEDARLVRIDPQDGAIEVVGYVGPVGRMTFRGRDLYLSGGSKYHTENAQYLRRIRDVVE